MKNYKPKKSAFKPLDEYEKQLIKDMENYKLVEIPNQEKEIKRYIGYFKKMPKKDKRLTIRIDKEDLKTIQQKAIKTGIPYQTLISAILRKFARQEIKIGI